MVNFKLLISLTLILLFSCQQIFSEKRLRTCEIILISDKGVKVSVNVEIADTDETRNRGLMFREKLAENAGMIFIFEESKKRAFWMKNTYIPLDIAYIDSRGIINEIYTMKPLDYSIIYNSIKPARYALEVNAGWFKKNNISAGSKLELYGCFSK
jgi:uncharacterized membrane protein (UPF0127 family)